MHATPLLRGPAAPLPRCPAYFPHARGPPAPHRSSIAAAPAPSVDTTHLVLVATADVRGRATAWDYLADREFAGGLVRAAAVIDALRARYPGRAIVLDAGDVLPGDSFADCFAALPVRPDLVVAGHGHRAIADSAIGGVHIVQPAAHARGLAVVHGTLERRTGAALSSAPAFDLAAGFRDGDILRRDVYALYPHAHTLRAIRISGAQLAAYLEHGARYFVVRPDGRVRPNDGIPGADFDLVAGATYEIDLRLPPGHRIRRLAVGGRPVAPTDTFTLAIGVDRLGDDGPASFRDAPVVYDRQEEIRALLVEGDPAPGLRRRGGAERRALADRTGGSGGASAGALRQSCRAGGASAA